MMKPQNHRIRIKYKSSVLFIVSCIPIVKSPKVSIICNRPYSKHTSMSFPSHQYNFVRPQRICLWNGPVYWIKKRNHSYQSIMCNILNMTKIWEKDTDIRKWTCLKRNYTKNKLELSVCSWRSISISFFLIKTMITHHVRSQDEEYIEVFSHCPRPDCITFTRQVRQTHFWLDQVVVSYYNNRFANIYKCTTHNLCMFYVQLV